MLGFEALRGFALLPWILLAVAAIADIVLSWRKGPELSVQAPDEIFVGETEAIAIKVSRPIAGLTASVEWPEGLLGPADFDFVQTSDKADAQVPCQAVRRGTWTLSTVWLKWPSRFGLFECAPTVDMQKTIRVIPNIRLIQSGEISTTVRSTLFGVKENKAIGEGSDFHQLQDFVQGMDVKSIDWKRSARRRGLVAKEMRAERNHNVIVALDNGYLMRERIDGLPKIDHAVTASLAVAWAATIGGDLLGYYSYDVRPRIFSKPTAGRQAFARFRSWTADLDYTSREANHTLALTDLNGRTPKRSLIIVFTDFIDTTSAELLVENLAILSKRHLLIFVAIRDTDTKSRVETAPETLTDVAQIVAADQSIQQRQLVMEKLTRLGVTVINATPKTVTSQLISAYLNIKAKEMI